LVPLVRIDAAFAELLWPLFLLLELLLDYLTPLLTDNCSGYWSSTAVSSILNRRLDVSVIVWGPMPITGLWLHRRQLTEAEKQTGKQKIHWRAITVQPLDIKTS